MAGGEFSTFWQSHQDHGGGQFTISYWEKFLEWGQALLVICTRERNQVDLVASAFSPMHEADEG